MDGLMSSFGKTLNTLSTNILPLVLQGIGFLYQYKLPITIAAIVFLLFYRIVMSNLLYLKKRRDTLMWVIWGILMVFQVLDFFVILPWLWFTVQMVIWIVCWGYVTIFDDVRQLKTTLYNSGCVFEDTSDRHDANKGEGSEAKQAKKDKEQKGRRHWSKDRVTWMKGVPVFTMKYTVMLSPTSKEEQRSGVLRDLSHFYRTYNWMAVVDGAKWTVSCNPQVNKVVVVPFPKDLSDALPWYIIPCGVIDASTKKTQQDTPLVWMLHDPKIEGKKFPELEKTQLMDKAPMGFCIGTTGSGKSVWMNTVISHLLNKAKTEGQVELYLADAKKVEFTAYEGIAEVKRIATTLEDAVDLLKEFNDEMMRRNDIMAAEKINKYAFDGHLTLKRHVDINGHVIPNNDVLEVRLVDGTETKLKAKEILGRTDIAEVNFPDPEPEEKEEDKGMMSMW